MQPLTTPTADPAVAEKKPEEQQAQPKPAEEPKKAPEVKTLDLASTKNDEVGGSLRPEMRPHAFVIMPFGKKKGGDGSLFDFNAIYTQLIRPTLEMAGFEPFRADEETTSGDILTDMFQELLLADLVLRIGALRPAVIGVDILMPEADPLSPERLLQRRGPDADPLASALVALPGNDVLLAQALSAAPSVLELLDLSALDLSVPVATLAVLPRLSFL